MNFTDVLGTWKQIKAYIDTKISSSGADSLPVGTLLTTYLNKNIFSDKWHLADGSITDGDLYNSGFEINDSLFLKDAVSNCIEYSIVGSNDYAYSDEVLCSTYYNGSFCIISGRRSEENDDEYYSLFRVIRINENECTVLQEFGDYYDKIYTGKYKIKFTVGETGIDLIFYENYTSSCSFYWIHSDSITLPNLDFTKILYYDVSIDDCSIIDICNYDKDTIFISTLDSGYNSNSIYYRYYKYKNKTITELENLRFKYKIQHLFNKNNKLYAINYTDKKLYYFDSNFNLVDCNFPKKIIYANYDLLSRVLYFNTDNADGSLDSSLYYTSDFVNYNNVGVKKSVNGNYYSIVLYQKYVVTLHMYDNTYLNRTSNTFSFNNNSGNFNQYSLLYPFNVVKKNNKLFILSCKDAEETSVNAILLIQLDYDDTKIKLPTISNTYIKIK